MAVRQCDLSVFVCRPVCPIEKPVTQKQQSHWSLSAFMTLLVIRMTFENVLAEDERLNSQWADLSAAKLQQERGVRETMQIEVFRICNLAISCCSALALAFQGEN